MRDNPCPEGAPATGNSEGAKITHDNLLIDMKATARGLCIGERTLWALTRRDAIPCVRVGRRVLYRPEELTAWLDCGAPTDPGAAARVREYLRKGSCR